MKKMVFILAVFLTLCISIPAMADVSEINLSNETSVVIEELGVSFKVPNHIEWATRTEGNYEIMKKTYSMDQEALISYMEASYEYCKGVDPSSDIRFFFSSEPASLFEKNTSLVSDEELLELFQSFEYVYTIDSIYNTKDAKFVVIKEELSEGQTCYICQTIVDGMIYAFSIRGRNDSYQRTLAYYLMETMVFNEKEYADVSSSQMILKSFSTTGTTFLIAESWERNYDVIPDSSGESICFINSGSDGLLRSIKCYVVDLCEFFNVDESVRTSLSGTYYSNLLAVSTATRLGVNANSIIEYKFSNRDFDGFMHYDNEIGTIRMFFLDNGYWYNFIFESFWDGDPFKDECYQDFENILNSIEFKS